MYVARTGTFSGGVFGATRDSEIPGVRVTSVLFTPGARTYWHRHEGGQILVVTAGNGILGLRSGELIPLTAGSVVTCPPGGEHFHGATHEAVFLHEAISIGPTEWLEEVADDIGQ